MELRAGAGGEDARWFCARMAGMYTRYAQIRGWRTEVLERRDQDPGCRSVTLKVTGAGVSALKGEAGGHSIQHRSKSRGGERIHTSTATVTVLDAGAGRSRETVVGREDVRENFFRGSGKGGQHRNKTDTAVRLTHIPTGVVVTVTSGRHRERNRIEAHAELTRRLQSRANQAASGRLAAARGGDPIARRGDVIRVYDEIRDVVRAGGLKVRGVRSILDGDLAPLIGA